MRRIPALVVVVAAVGLGAVASTDGVAQADPVAGDRLIARAVLPAATFANGPTSGTRIGGPTVNGIPTPFVDKQPVQGFSAVHDNDDGTFLVMSDNGYGSLENSADFRLRVHHIRPNWETRLGGSGTIDTLGFTELSDPDGHVPFPITNEFNGRRFLTGADFDIESLVVANDGTWWFGDEFGPYVIHTDSSGKVLEPPIALTIDGGEVLSPQSPLLEEATAVRMMNALATNAHRFGGATPVFSPWSVMLRDNDPATFVENRAMPPAGSGLPPASSEVFDPRQMADAGFQTVPYTINDSAQMAKLIRLGDNPATPAYEGTIDGIISDRPDLLFTEVDSFDADGDGTPGDFLDADGLIDIAKFDSQGHRGARNLRPENTLPAFEAALDNLVTTLELDTGLSRDGVSIVDHDPYVQSEKCRLADGTPYGPADEVLLKDLTAARIQKRFICDKVFRGPSQLNDRALSPVAVAFAASEGLVDPYVPATLAQVFGLVDAYVAYYQAGPAGVDPAVAAKRAKNAARVRFNIETKLNPRGEFADRTAGPERIARTVAITILRHVDPARADIQSFDFRTLLEVQRRYPMIRTVALFGDFPIYDDPTIPGSDDSTNLQDEDGANTPWLAGMLWPYRQTLLDHPARVARSGGFEGMAISPDGATLYPLLERPLTGDAGDELLILELDVATRSYTGVTHRYPLDARGSNIGDFVLFDDASGLVIERDNSQGSLSGYKSVNRITLQGDGELVDKQPVLDLMKIADPQGISRPGEPGDVGVGDPFAFPFVTIEDVVVLGPRVIGVLNDNNFPFSIGRHVGSATPDDNEFIVVRLDERLRGGPLSPSVAGIPGN